MDWFPWYPERYKNKTLHLTAEQDGIYRRLIDHYMETRQPLPDNNHALARISGVSGECFEHASSIIRAFFKQEKGGLLSHETCNQLLDEQDNQAKFRSERAEKAANKRWQNQKDTCSEHASSNARAMLGDATITVNNNSNNKVSNNIIAPDGVSADVWKDFITHRKAKKAPVTNTALEAIKREAVKADIGLQEALETIVNRGWTGFKAEWIKNGNTSVTPRQTLSGDGSPAGEQTGFGGRKSQTQLAAEITDQIKRDRRAKWEADQKLRGQSGSAIGFIATDVHDVEEIR